MSVAGSWTGPLGLVHLLRQSLWSRQPFCGTYAYINGQRDTRFIPPTCLVCIAYCLREGSFMWAW